MRKDYDAIKQNFTSFIETWKTRDVECLKDLVAVDVHGFLSIIGSSEGGEQHSLFGIRAFVQDIPQTDHMDYEICHYICRVNGNQAHQAAEVPCIAKNNNGDYFTYVATFCNGWIKEDETWKMNEIRMDIMEYESPLSEYFKKTWYFEDNLAVLTAAVHLPCVFPDIDNPYYRIPECEDVLTEEEKIQECFAKFIYGIDWIVFTFCRDTLSDGFKNKDKKTFVAETKWERQSFRYWCHPYMFENIEINGDFAVARLSSMIDDCRIQKVEFVKEATDWKILSYAEGV